MGAPPRSARFQLEVSLDDRTGHLMVNAIPVLRNYRPHRIDVDVPVTEFMTPGANVIEWELIADDEANLPHDARARALLQAKPLEAAQWSAVLDCTQIGPVLVPGQSDDGAGETPIGRVGSLRRRIDARAGLVSVSRQIDLTLRLPEWAWTRSPPILNSPATLNSLIGFYKRLHDFLGTGDMPALLRLHAEKAHELALAYGVSREEAMREIGLPFMPAEHEWRLIDPVWDELRMEPAAGGRLARLFHPRNGAPLVYREASGVYRTFDLWVRGGANAWTITR